MRPETFETPAEDLKDGKVRHKGNFKISCKDPYGFWYISLLKGGNVPGDLAGTYTNVSLAERAIEIYENKKEK